MITGNLLMREGYVMNWGASHKRLVCSAGFGAVLIVLFAGGGGCGRKASPVTKGGLEFKKQIRETIERLEPLLLESASKEDRKTAETTLEKFASDAFQKNRVRPLLMVSLISEVLPWPAGRGPVLPIQETILRNTMPLRKFSRTERFFKRGSFYRGDKIYCSFAFHSYVKESWKPSWRSLSDPMI
jgi:hypothetical protein